LEPGKCFGVVPMPEYRFFAVRKDGHVSEPPITCLAPNDPTAVTEAKRLLNGHDIEVRQGVRVVAYVVSDDPGQS
jgi:hypothetical protein